MIENKTCDACGKLKKDKVPKKEREKKHIDCHDWYHCGDDCCGGCPYCESGKDNLITL